MWVQRHAVCKIARRLLIYRTLHTTSAMPSAKPLPKVDPNANVGFLFPGQGAQELKMTEKEQSIPAVAQMYATAADVLGYDLKKIVMEEEQQINETKYCQPAMLIAGLAAVEKLKLEDPDALKLCQAAAGLSLGEYTALVHAGAMSLEDALRVVQVRAQGMQAAGEAQKGTMLSIVGVDDAAIAQACERAAAATGQVATVANLLAPGIRAVSGGPDALQQVHDALKDEATKVAFLVVSGAFHTSMMAPAAEGLKKVLAEVDIRMPEMKVYANTTGKPYESVEQIRTELVKQVVEPVLWETTMKAMVADGHTSLYELGPRRQIKSMLRKVDPAVFKKTVNVTV
eukprot:TRINITY_DN4528_c0_g1_i1.p1 TRINITY_DN4528_c0_g1~~TRINITY_DN4528_c0_g1_i1.p1  ORF type:complete len:342 (+),score=97.39 TRINITY_DN4528_c0_g1_i1:52-1077(+)